MSKINYKFLNKEGKYNAIPYANPVDWFNQNYDFVEVVNYANKVHHKNGKLDPFAIISSNKVLKNIEKTNINGGTPYKGKFTHEFDLDKKIVKVLSDNAQSYFGKTELTLFEFATVECFFGNPQSLYNYVNFEVLKNKIPYIRVGVDFYKFNHKVNRYGVKVLELKGWNKQTLMDDFGKTIISQIVKFDDFTIEPNNVNYKPIIGNFYNLYSEFSHKPIDCNDLKEIPVIDNLMQHIFGEQKELGFKYLKVLYENPKQALPIVVLVSKERQTGKTTFLNMLQIIFGSNYELISPEALINDFNSSFATKNIIGIDETTMDKSASIERLKAIATQKTIMVNQKHVSQYSIPFFGKVVICSNREKDFIRIDEEEIRFWVRKVPVLKKVNPLIEQHITEEVPKLLGYLKQLPEIDFTKSRMVFTKEEIATEQLNAVVEKSKSGLYKELDYIFKDYFANYTIEKKAPEFMYCTPKDIKNKWFLTNNNISISYISDVLRDEFQYTKVDKTMRYTPFADKIIKFGDFGSVTGFPFKIPNVNYNLNIIYFENEENDKQVENQNINADNDLPW